MSAPTQILWQTTIYVGTATEVYYSNYPPVGSDLTGFHLYSINVDNTWTSIHFNAAYVSIQGYYPYPPIS